MISENGLKALIVALVVLVDAVWIYAGGYTFDVASALPLMGILVVLGIVGWIYTYIRIMPPFSVMCIDTAFLLAFSAAGAMLSYLVTGLDFPLIDQTLIAVDRSIGFDWTSYVAFVNKYVWLGVVSTLVYSTTLVQIAFAIIFLPLLGNLDRTKELMLVVMVSALITIIISGILPAAGALATYMPDPSFYLQNNPMVDLDYKQAFFDLRSGELTALSLEAPKGLIAFPSYHVALAIVTVIALRGYHWVFWPILTLNIGVILSTPIDGGHHLVDGLAGACVALLSFVLVRAFRKRVGYSDQMNTAVGSEHPLSNPETAH